MFIGENVAGLPPRRDVVYTGFVSDTTKTAGIAGAELLVQPSDFESFSIVLCEAWAARIPALVQGRCDVLVGQARRSGGTLPYTGYAEFEAGLDLLLADAEMRRGLASAGRAYVERTYSWPHVIARYQKVFERVA